MVVGRITGLPVSLVPSVPEAIPQPAFRLAEILDTGYRRQMSTANRVALPQISNGEISIAGVPWPLYKVVALAVGLAVLLIVGVATTSAAPAVLGAAGAATVVWLGFSIFHPED